eukprot:scaffold13561_cov129-Isochrysis_galbana.AAC.4
MMQLRMAMSHERRNEHNQQGRPEWPGGYMIDTRRPINWDRHHIHPAQSSAYRHTATQLR